MSAREGPAVLSAHRLLDEVIAGWSDVSYEETREHVGGLRGSEVRLAVILAGAAAAVLGLGILMWWLLALERRKMGSALESAAAQKEAVERVATEVAAGVEPERILELVAREAARLTVSDEAVVCRLDSEGYHALDIDGAVHLIRQPIIELQGDFSFNHGHQSQVSLRQRQLGPLW